MDSLILRKQLTWHAGGLQARVLTSLVPGLVLEELSLTAAWQAQQSQRQLQPELDGA